MPSKDQDLLEVDDLHVHYRNICALRDVRFTIGTGQSVAVVGRNGAGKSTLLKALAGVIPDASGSVRWQGRVIDTRKRRTLFAYLPQREEIDWNFPITVRGLVDMGMYSLTGAWGTFTQSHRNKVSTAIARMGLEGLEGRRIGELSGGQQQRVFLARAIAGGAQILLLDEPFAGLDTEATESLSKIIRGLIEEGALVLASHHDLKSIADSFAYTLLLRTKQLAYGPSREILTDTAIREAFS